MATKKANEKTTAEMATIGPGLLHDSKTLPEAKTSPLQR
jgi:hypothetical protein